MILMAAWKAEKYCAWAVERALGLLPTEILSGKDYYNAIKEMERQGLYPVPTAARQTVRVLVAKRSSGASDALFDGNEQLAAKRMHRPQWIRPSTLKTQSMEGTTVKERARERQKFLNDMNRTVFVEKRKLDHRHDWKTVK